MKNIAVLVQNLVQFYSIKNGVDALIGAGYKVDIYVPTVEDTDGFKNILNDTFDALCKMGYAPLRDPSCAGHCKILLEPYPIGAFSEIPHDYRLKYKYALLSAKPEPSFHTDKNIIYDAELLFSPYEAKFLSAFTKVELIGNLKYASFEKPERPATDKKILLYLPTYGDISSIDPIADTLAGLKDEYYIITKLHHGTSFLISESDRIGKVVAVSDEHYDHRTELASLLSIADVVLSDNSGAIFESLFAGVPLAVCSEDLDRRRIGGLDTTQYKLAKEGIIPHTTDASCIADVLRAALSDEVASRQREIRHTLFHLPDDPVAEFVKVIEKYLNDEADRDFKAIHDLILDEREHFISECEKRAETIREREREIEGLKGEISGKMQTISELEGRIAQRERECEGLNNDIADRDRAREALIAEHERRVRELDLVIEQKDRAIGYYENGKLYRIAKKIYGLYFKLKPGGGGK
ncbi:MAG: CDP-glycerol glycerophosphotransferase family protein [Clostridia bacterium]|nr:CDP-glycerol glycerophosphotransferase family protein [Clostridia bacterium]